MRIAIVCDWLVQLGGAEKVLEQLLLCFPEADLFAVIDFVPEHQRGFLQGKSVQTTFIQKLPFARTRYRTYLPLMPLAIEQLDVSAYDLVLSTSHAVAKGILTGPDQIHISYIHSPMRYAWDLQHQYLKESGLDQKWRGWLARYFLHRLRVWDYRSSVNIDHMIANSHFIARRIKKTYGRESTVIHPPIDLTRYTVQTQKENFYLTASRLVPYKRVDLIVQAFSAMPDKQLIVIGDGPDFAKIKALAGSNIQIMGYQSDDVLISHMQRARAFIFAAEEDFGLVPVEAQACGTPVIAYGKGGALETVRDLSQSNPTGLFFKEQTVESICKGVRKFEDDYSHFNSMNCSNNAEQFSTVEFKQKMIDLVKTATT
jgi:glycosyltransferase involved in cell wall biosynthesis